MRATQILTFGGVGSVAAGGWHGIAGSTPGTVGALLVLLGTALLGLSWFVHTGPPRVKVKGAARSAAPVVVGVLVVSSLVVGGLAPSPVGSADAKHDCGEVTGVLTDVMPDFVPKLDKCLDHPVTKNIDDNQTAIDIYSAAQSAEQRQDEARTVRNNYLANSRTIAYAKGQSAAVAALNNGSTETQVINAGRDAVKKYYTNKQLNILKGWETRAKTLEELSERAANESGVSDSLIFVPSKNKRVQYNSAVLDADYQLINGTNVNIHVTNIYDNGDYDVIMPDPSNSTNINTSKSNTPVFDYNISVDQVDVSHPTDQVLDTIKYSDELQNIYSLSTNVEDNVDSWADKTYHSFQNSTFNTSEYVDPTTLAQEFATDYNSTGYYSYAAASLAVAGLGTPNLTNTGRMTVSNQGTNITGLLMSQASPPNGTWETGVTYNAGVLDGEQFVIDTNGTQQNLIGDFTITSMTDTDGSSITETKSENYSHQAINNDEYLAQQENLTDLRTAMESRESSSIGGGSGGGGGSLSTAAMLGLLGAVGGAFLLLRGGRN